MSDPLKDLANDLQATTRNVAGVHYVTFRLTGGFGPRTAATLAATAALQDELRHGDSEYLAAYPRIHKKLADFLQTKGEESFQNVQRLQGESPC